MSNKSIIWCAHPNHDELLPNGKKRFWKTGVKPSHPKGKTSIKEDLAEFINNYHERILNGSSKKLSKGDYLCKTCFEKEHNHLIFPEEDMDIDHSPEDIKFNDFDSGSDNYQNSPMDEDYVRVDLDATKKKLNQVFEYVNIKIIDDM